MYWFFFLVGAIGFLAVTVLGFTHGSHGHSGHHSHTGHSHGGVSFKGFGHHASHSAKSVHGSHQSKFFYISPVTFFGISLGFGASGVLFLGSLTEPTLLIVSVLAGFVLQFLIIGPLVSMLLKFASKPSAGMTGSVSSYGEAVSKFDSSGRGLVKLEVEGELVQRLGVLDAGEHERCVSVARGDRLMILAVDESRDQCTVSKEFAS